MRPSFFFVVALALGLGLANTGCDGDVTFARPPCVPEGGASQWYTPRFNAEQRRRLGDRVAADVARFGQRLRGDLGDGRGAPAGFMNPQPGLEALGLLSPPTLLRVYHAGVATQLVPRLREVGIPIELTELPQG